MNGILFDSQKKEVKGEIKIPVQKNPSADPMTLGGNDTGKPGSGQRSVKF